MRRTRKSSINREATSSDSEDPLLGVRVEIKLETVRKKMGSAYADFTLVPPSTALEVDLLHRQLLQEKRKGVERELLMAQIWKTISGHIYLCCPWKGYSPA